MLGAPVAAIGLIESIAEATASFLKVFSGWLSDRVGRRRPLIALGYTISNVAKPLLALTASWPAVLLLRFSDRFGKGVRTAPRDALIADSGTAARRGRDFGFHRALDTLGAAIGPLTAWAILTLVPDGYRTVFWVSAVPGTLAIVVVFAAVREVRARPAAATGGSGGSPGGERARPKAPTIRLRHLGRPFALFTAASAVFALGNSSDALLILRAQDVGTAPALIPLMYFVFNVVGAALASPLGSLSDRVGRKTVLAAGFGGYALVYAGFALAHAPLRDLAALRALRRAVCDDRGAGAGVRLRSRAGRGAGDGRGRVHLRARSGGAAGLGGRRAAVGRGRARHAVRAERGADGRRRGAAGAGPGPDCGRSPDRRPPLTPAGTPGPPC